MIVGVRALPWSVSPGLCKVCILNLLIQHEKLKRSDPMDGGFSTRMVLDLVHGTGMSCSKQQMSKIYFFNQIDGSLLTEIAR